MLQLVSHFQHFGESLAGDGPQRANPFSCNWHAADM